VSFLIDHYYLIEPTPQLTELVRAALDANFATVILERVVVAKQHMALHAADDANVVALKLAFLSLLWVDRIWDTATQFEQLFGSTSIDAELFDRWWTLTEVECVRFEEWESFVGRAVPFIRPQSDPRVARWLAEQQRHAEPDTGPDSIRV
jgi:hypothetical protein